MRRLPVRGRLERAQGSSSGWYDTRESVLVRLGDTDGRTGWGEAGLRPGVVEAARELGVTLAGTEVDGTYGGLL